MFHVIKMSEDMRRAICAVYVDNWKDSPY